jgi:tRNA C32,U32 (ribose-2'-O)-methylase TrmJ
MNLGQAVAVCCYELQRFFQFPQAAAEPSRPSSATASVGEIARLVEAIERVFPVRESAREREHGPARKRRARLRQMLLQLPLRSADVALLLGVVRDLSRQLQKSPKALLPQ